MSTYKWSSKCIVNVIRFAVKTATPHPSRVIEGQTALPGRHYGPAAHTSCTPKALRVHQPPSGTVPLRK
jgi:hypothetical protein